MHLNKLNARRKSFVLCLIGRGRGKWKKRTQCPLCKWVKPGRKRPYKSWLELIFPLSLQQAHLWWKVCCEKVHLGKLLGWERIIWNLAFFLGIFLEPGFHFRECIPGCFNQLEPRSGCWFCLACCIQVGNEIYCTASAPSKSWENENKYNTEVVLSNLAHICQKDEGFWLFPFHWSGLLSCHFMHWWAAEPFLHFRLGFCSPQNCSAVILQHTTPLQRLQLVKDLAETFSFRVHRCSKWTVPLYSSLFLLMCDLAHKQFSAKNTTISKISRRIQNDQNLFPSTTGKTTCRLLNYLHETASSLLISVWQ